jgi:hypothetical protein
MPTPKETALSACRQLMEPIIGILLRNGITHKDLALVCKHLYVQVAAQEFGIRGRATNLSRIAMLTGIDRKEAARIKESWQHNSESQNAQHSQDRLTRILSGWHQDPDFLDAQGLPLIISSEHFAQLARRYGGDMPASALLKELKNHHIVEDDAAGNLRVLKRNFVPAQSDPAALLRAGSVFHDLGSTLQHNLYKANAAKNKPLHFERRASNTQMPPETADLFRKFVDQEGQAFLEKVDAWLSAHEQVPSEELSTKQLTSDAQNTNIRLGVGAYLIENTLPHNATNPNQNAEDGDAE